MLREKLAEIKVAVEAWEDNKEASTVQWGNGEIKLLGEDVVGPINELFQLIETSDFEEHDWGLVLAIERFRQAFLGWFRLWQDESTRHQASPAGGASMWVFFNAVYQIMDAPPPIALESPAIFEKQDVSPQQMAKAYGWRLSNGSPDVTKVQEELNEPGKHFKHPMFDPGVEVMRNKIAAEYQDFIALRDSRQANVQAEAAPAPESLEQLIQEKVSVRQILKMKPGTTREEILAKAEQLGVALDERASIALSRNEETQEQLDREAQERVDSRKQIQETDSREDIEDRDERILALSEDGLAPKQIVELLAADYPELSYQAIGRLLAKAEKVS